MATIPDWSNVTTPDQFLAMPNESTGGWFWTGMDLMIFIILFITMAGAFGWEAGMLSACFAGLLISLFLVYLGLVAWWVVGMFIGMILLIFIYIIWSNRYD
jgi:hypothetical protein